MGRKALEAEEKKQAIMSKHGYRCQRCGAPAISLAHRIAQTKANIKKWGEYVIHHEINLVPVCSSQRCNSSFNIGNNPRECKKLVESIKREAYWWEV